MKNFQNNFVSIILFCRINKKKQNIFTVYLYSGEMPPSISLPIISSATARNFSNPIVSSTLSTISVSDKDAGRRSLAE